jgi:hypothetical protein
MPSPEERKVMHLANIGNYLYDLVKVMAEVNTNLVELGKILKESDESYEQIVSDKGPMMVLREAEDVQFVDDKPFLENKISNFTEKDFEYNKFARLPNEFDEHFKKEGE